MFARYLNSVTLSLILVWMAATSAQATTAATRLDVPQLTALSDAVVHGAVRSIESYLEGEDIFTRIEISVEERIKSEATRDPETSGNTTVLRLLGGTYEGIRTFAIGSACFDEGEEVVVFLKANGTETYDVINLSEGKFSVDRSVQTIERVTRDLHGIHYLDPTDPDIPQSLEELKESVRNAVQAETR